MTIAHLQFVSYTLPAHNSFAHPIVAEVVRYLQDETLLRVNALSPISRYIFSCSLSIAQLLLACCDLLDHLMLSHPTAAEVARHLQDEPLLRVNALGPLWLISFA